MPFKIILIVAGLALAIAGVLYGYPRYEVQMDAARRSAVEISIDTNNIHCPPNFPIPVTIKNGSDKTVQKIVFWITANRVGYSDFVYSVLVTSTKIQSPGESWSECYDYGGSIDKRKSDEKSFPGMFEWKGFQTQVNFQD